METYSVSLSIIEEVPVLVIEGDMTSESDSDVMKAYNEIKKEHAPDNIIINFEKTKYINSAGIASLINSSLKNQVIPLKNLLQIRHFL